MLENEYVKLYTSITDVFAFIKIFLIHPHTMKLIEDMLSILNKKLNWNILF